MSSLRKSASFRSRIPVRRIKPQPRRCYSPQSAASISKREQFYVNEHELFQQQQQQQQKAKRNNNNNNNRNEESSQFLSSVETFGKRSAIWLADDSSHRYSSSSYSSSDESDDSSDVSAQVSLTYVLLKYFVYTVFIQSIIRLSVFPKEDLKIYFRILYKSKISKNITKFKIK